MGFRVKGLGPTMDLGLRSPGFNWDCSRDIGKENDNYRNCKDYVGIFPGL